MVFIIESQIQYVVDCLQTMRSRGLKSVDVKPDAQARYNESLQARLAKTVWNTGGCASWYRTAEGRNTTLWPGFTVEFRLRTRRFDPAPYHLIPLDGPDRTAGRGRRHGESFEQGAQAAPAE
jgi:cyclohexanone monooxygenase